jgi:MHS family proline/betaine transporter-like MFS transporter
MRKVVTASMVGNGLEWYDFAIYGHMAVILRDLFFPDVDPVVGLIATYGVFAAGFVARPLGAILFGWMGDKYGRRTALTVAVLMMAIPTGAIGLLPTYEMIGIAAPILLTIIRIFQGLSLGGEFSGSITFMVEHAPKARRGLIGSMSMVSLIIGFMLGSVVANLFSSLLSPEDFQSWGWRIPFILGIAIGFVGFYIRTHCEESPHYEQAKAEGTLSRTPVREAITGYWPQMLEAFAIYATVTMPFYLVSIYFISFTELHLGLSKSQSLTLNTANLLLMLIAFPLSALWSDRVGRKKVLVAVAALMMAMIYPIFISFEPGNFWNIALLQAALAVLVGFYIGPVPALLVEMFPTSIRYTGLAIPYNLTAAIFGGTTPMVCVWLISQTGDSSAVAFYVIFCTLLSLTALYYHRDRHQEELT